MASDSPTERTSAPQIADEIIDKIKRNRISSTEIADCMDKSGSIPNLSPINRGHFRVGKVFWTYAFEQSNWNLHAQVPNIQKDEILLAEPFECDDRALFGSLLSKYVLLYRQAAGIVVRGKLRDIPHLIKENWPIWCEGPNPIGCFNRQNEKTPDSRLLKQQQERYEGAIAVCDDTGVVIVPKHLQTKEFLAKLDWVEEQEDIWFDCIDRRKWNTYETVCLKKYLQE